MSDITMYNQGNVSDEGKINWRAGDSAVDSGDQSIFDTSTVPLTAHGQVKVVGDRIFRYGRVGAVAAALKPGQALQINVRLAFSTAAAADPAGGKQITYFFSSAAASGTVAANYYAEGYIYFGGTGTSTQMGMSYRVKSHAAVATSGNATIYLYEPLKYSVSATADGLVLMKNPFDGLIANATGAVFCPGICVVNATTNDYMWIQTGGPCPVRQAAAGAIQGTPLALGTSGAALPMLITTANATYQLSSQIIGYAMHVGTASIPGMVWLNIEQ